MPKRIREKNAEKQNLINARQSAVPVHDCAPEEVSSSSAHKLVVDWIIPLLIQKYLSLDSIPRE